MKLHPSVCKALGPPAETEWLTPAAVANRTGRHVSTVARWIQTGTLKAYRVGGRWLIADGDLLMMLSRPPEAAPAGQLPRQESGHEKAMRELRAAGWCE